MINEENAIKKECEERLHEYQVTRMNQIYREFIELNESQDNYQIQFCPKCGIKNPVTSKGGFSNSGKQMVRCSSCNKRFVEDTGRLTFYTLQNENPGNTRHFLWYDDSFYKYCQTHPIETRTDKTFKFIHLEGAHPYYRLDKNLNDIRGIGEPNYDTSLEAACTAMREYLNDLKESGVYDNSVIVIMGDHGFPDGSPYGDRHNAMFMVKGLMERHPFAISDKAMSYDYLTEIYENLLAGKTGEEIYPFTTYDKTRISGSCRIPALECF